MNSHDPAELTQSVVPLSLEARRRAREYWERVIREEFVPVEQRVWCPPSLEEWDERRARRRARRGLASVTRLAQVHRVQVEQSNETAPGPEAA